MDLKGCLKMVFLENGSIFEEIHLPFLTMVKNFLELRAQTALFSVFIITTKVRSRRFMRKDGRRISYIYNVKGDLTEVHLPNAAVTFYEYDRDHHIIRETKPCGKILENIYEQGRVKEQRSPMGPQQQIITTTTFDYQEGQSVVTDAAGGKTTYKIFQKQIYKITDPLGYATYHSWFLDDKSWFDAESEKIMAWDQKGGARRA